ncbi:protein kinase family protein [Nonomuraea africana]|uniref:protein kinase family protein n=1 Tax=Nonomuraea africana TaxID=46171 RepID=UPI0033D8F5DE
MALLLTLARRLAAHSTVSTHLSLLSDRRLGALVDGATALGTGIGGTSALLEIEGVKVFVKRVPLTDLERRPENVRSTANLFDLPCFYQYGVGSAGFGVWRELAVHTMTTNWVLAGEHSAFPLMHHWRVLPGPPPSDSTVHAWFGDMESLVEHWEGAEAVRHRLEGIRGSSAGVVLFLEYFPHTLGTWLAGQDISAYTRVDEELTAGAAFMRGKGLVHFDAHFGNILTEGDHLYFSDFGLALSSRFDLSAEERRFLSLHRDYDLAYTAAHLVNHHLAERVRGEMEVRRFVREWPERDRPEGVPAQAAALLTKHARTAVTMSDFHRRLFDESKETPYPAAELDSSA